MSPQTEFGLGRAAICFPSHRSLFTVMYFVASFEYQVAFSVKTMPSSMPTEVNVLHSWAVVLSKF